MKRSTALSLAGLISVACGSAPSSIVVDLRTDFVPGVEFVAVETRAAPADDGELASRRSTALGGDDYLDGMRVAEWDAVASGTYDVTASLLDASGQVVAHRVRRRGDVQRIERRLSGRRVCSGGHDLLGRQHLLRRKRIVLLAHLHGRQQLRLRVRRVRRRLRVHLLLLRGDVGPDLLLSFARLASAVPPSS